MQYNQSMKYMQFWRYILYVHLNLKLSRDFLLLLELWFNVYITKTFSYYKKRRRNILDICNRPTLVLQ